MATDVKAAALAEARWGALAGVDPGVYLNLGTGLAAAIWSSAAGSSPARTGRPGRSATTSGGCPTSASHSGPGPLEEAVSGRALGRRLAGRPAAEVVRRGRRRARARAVADQFIIELAFHVVNLAIVMNPVRIAVGGGMTRSWDRIRPQLDAALDSAAPYRPELVLADFPSTRP